LLRFARNDVFYEELRNTHAPFQAKMAEKAHGYCAQVLKLFPKFKAYHGQTKRV
jgi:hypothetical protein